MAYIKTTWVNDQEPAISAENLNKIEQGIYQAHTFLDNKIDKVSGKGLSTNDYTNEDKANVTVIRSEISELNASNLYSEHSKFNNYRSNGITFNYENGKMHIYGTSTAQTFVYLNGDSNTLPSFFRGGETYRIKYDSEQVKFRVYDKTSGTSKLIVDTTKSMVYTFPETMTIGSMRLFIESGVTLDETIRIPMFLQEKTNKELTDDIDYLLGDTLLPNGTTDRTNDIIAVLNKYGYCKFAEGDFYVNDRIELEDGQSILGANKNTKLRKPSGVTTGGFFHVADSVSNVTFRDLTFLGTNTSKPSASVSSGAYGIFIEGNAGYITVDNCMFNGLYRCGIIVTSGFSWLRSVNIVNSSFMFCNKGIEFANNGEFANVTNCNFISCYYGVSNLGGNNKFSSCGFDACEVGMLLYDPDGSHNNGHGTASACTFNHCTEAGIRAISCTKGYVFDGCQIYYGGIRCTNSKGLIFSDCQIRGGSETGLRFTDCGLAIFDTCVFVEEPVFTLSNSPLIKKTNCYLRETGEPV